MLASIESLRNPVRTFFKPMAVAAIVALLAFSAAVWATDFITVSGEWTIYTARCDDGVWQANTCTGTLKPGERHRFRALRSHREVLYWVIGEQGESGRYLKCDVHDGRNWTCPGERQGPPAIANRMKHGIPAAVPGAPPMRRIPKWRWALLEAGLPGGHTTLN